MSDEDLIIHVLDNLSKYYVSLIDNFEKELDKDELTDMRLKLSTKYDRMREKKDLAIKVVMAML